jgi:hypothetical protein
MMMKTTCECCDKEFVKRHKTNKFCSKSCSAKVNNRKFPKRKRTSGKISPNTPCKECGVIIGRNSNYFCSAYCCSVSKVRDRVAAGNASCSTIKKYLQQIKDSCSICDLPNVWKDKPIVMVLDHIDGNSENNSLCNLRLVCPNCDSQLPTFKNRNKGKGRHKRRDRYHEGKSY